MLPIAPDTLLQQRYSILNVLGEGKFGRTYLATDRSRSNAYCAIEEIPLTAQLPSIVTKARDSLKREVVLLYQLQHLQLPRFWIVFEEQDRLFLVRDYIQGQTYSDLLQARRDLQTTFSEVEVQQFLLQVLPAIGYLHSKGVIHRDLSPQHLVCREIDGLPVPIDFGIVKEVATTLHSNPGNSQTPYQPGYAPIEQIHNGQVYPNSDLYALAVTAIVLLTGKEPSALFDNNVPSTDPLRQRINWDWRKWTPINDDFAMILGRMLSPDPNDRYQSAIEVSQDLQSLALPQQTQPDPYAASPNPDPYATTPNRPSTLPTVAMGNEQPTAVGTQVKSSITNLNGRSVWEKPQVFIPAAVLISLLAAGGGWFGVTQWKKWQQQSANPVATTPPKQIDFKNPTIPTDTASPSPATGDSIQPEMDKAVFKEGTVDGTTPVRYRISALAGQNLDIQLVTPNSTATSLSPTATITPSASDSTNKLGSSPSPSISPSISKPKNSDQNPPVLVPSVAPTQVLMTVLSPTGVAIDNQADRVVGWKGQIQTSGEYTIELRPIKGLIGNTFPYKLSVTQLSTTPINNSTTTPSTESSPSPETTPSTESTPATGTSSGNESSTPSSGSTPPIGVPVPNTSSPNPLPSNNGIIPGSVISPVPIVVPTTTPSTSAEQPTRRRRRRRTQVESTPESTPKRNRVVESTEESPTPRRRRNRVVESTEESPTPRRRRNRVVESTEESPTPRRRRNRTNSESTPSPSPATSPDNSDSGSSTPKPEPSVGIPVPPAKTTTPQTTKPEGDKTTPSSNSNNNDPD
jgi:serine/threonine protein kinase